MHQERIHGTEVHPVLGLKNTNGSSHSFFEVGYVLIEHNRVWVGAVAKALLNGLGSDPSLCRNLGLSNFSRGHVAALAVGLGNHGASSIVVLAGILVSRRNTSELRSVGQLALERRGSCGCMAILVGGDLGDLSACGSVACCIESSETRLAVLASDGVLQDLVLKVVLVLWLIAESGSICCRVHVHTLLGPSLSISGTQIPAVGV